MRIKIWGTRGSVPVAAPQFSHYGGDTVCIETRTYDGDIILLDAGTGICAFERSMRGQEMKKPPVICLTHYHADHVQGLPFFPPIYSREKSPVIYGPDFGGEQNLENSLAHLFDGVTMPLKFSELPGLDTRGIKPGSSFRIGSALVETYPCVHPGGGIAYKISADGWSFTYTGDHEIPLDDSEPEKNAANENLLNFLKGAEIVLADCQYDRSDHLARKGWGHSHHEQWALELAKRGVGKLVFIHYSPEYDDARLDSLIHEARDANLPIGIHGSWPGCELDENGIIEAPAVETDCKICGFFRRIGDFSDTHAVFSALLTEARNICNCDAGTIYIVENDNLVFSAAQNATLFPASTASKFAYMNSRLPMNPDSIAGFVATTGNCVNIPDVYFLDKKYPFKFNDSFDRKTGYTSKSMLVLPLVNGKGKVIGVLQLINALNNYGKAVSFTPYMQKTVYDLCSLTTIPIERALLITDMITRTLKTAALRDPSETAGHVSRVGSMAAELYHRWALHHDIDPEELLAEKGKLRLAAMLHDVGKVGIPDKILKKPGKLDEDERALMQGHAALGAGLFDDAFHDIDLMARDIALHHHARWDGKGYTGSVEIVSPAGADIPLAARITAIADVYDALVSKRCYKDSWDPAKAIEILQNDAGTHFDPELVKYFLEIQDIVQAIFERYSEQA